MKHLKTFGIQKQLKSFITKTLSVCLAFSVLLATSSFTADMHFCCNKLIDIGIYSKAKTCIEKNQKTEKPSRECSVGDEECCSNMAIVKVGDDNLKKVNFESDTKSIIFLRTYINLFEGLEKNVVPFLNYDPPFLKKDIVLLDETFLI